MELVDEHTVPALHRTADTFTSHYHTQPAQAADLQSKLNHATDR